MRNIINISLPPNMAKQVKQEVKEGNYASTSEFFRHLLRTQNTIKLANELKERRKEFEAGKANALRSLKDLR
jgi:Arc/MetJ-type ribon-helix-helix transcriptional regulator